MSGFGKSGNTPRQPFGSAQGVAKALEVANANPGALVGSGGQIMAPSAMPRIRAGLLAEARAKVAEAREAVAQQDAGRLAAALDALDGLLDQAGRTG